MTAQDVKAKNNKKSFIKDLSNGKCNFKNKANGTSV